MKKPRSRLSALAALWGWTPAQIRAAALADSPALVAQIAEIKQAARAKARADIAALSTAAVDEWIMRQGAQAPGPAPELRRKPNPV
jgi:hypothetical protein